MTNKKKITATAADERSQVNAIPVLTEEEIFSKMQNLVDRSISQEKAPIAEGLFERSFNAIQREQADFDAAQPAYHAKQAQLQAVARGGTFMKPFREETVKQEKMSKAFLAAAAVGLFASMMLTAHSTKHSMHPSMDAPKPVASISATAKLLKVCHLNLPAIQLSSVSNTLEEWSPMWLASNAHMPVIATNELCSQLLVASLQSPSMNNAGNPAAFQESLEEAKQLMLEQIADQVIENDKISEDLAPLMGLTPSDIQHYFKAVKKGSPPEGNGPTPVAGPYFSI